MKSIVQIDNHFENPFFIATVEDNKDPEFNYRVKVRIEQLHPEQITTEQLPWAARVDTAFMGIGDEQDINHKVPEVGTKVLVLAVGSDPNSLLYLGCLYKKTPQTPSDATYLDTYGIYRKDGQFIGIDKIQKLFKLIFDGDIEIDKIHNMTIKVNTKTTLECPATIITGDVRINGNLKVSKKVIGSTVQSIMGNDLDKHVHSGVFPGPANTTPPVPGA